MSKYSKDVSGYQTIDVYDLIQIYEVTNPALQHALKKILMAGQRGHKDFEQDCQDIIDSVNRAKALQRKVGINALIEPFKVPFECTIQHKGIQIKVHNCSESEVVPNKYIGYGLKTGFAFLFQKEDIVNGN